MFNFFELIFYLKIQIRVTKLISGLDNKLDFISNYLLVF